MPQQPMTQTLNITAARSQLSELVNRVFSRETRVVIKKSGIPVAVLVSADDAARLEQYEQQHQEDFAVIDRLREAFADVPVEEHEREVARAVREVRARRRARQAQPPASPST